MNKSYHSNSKKVFLSDILFWDIIYYLISLTNILQDVLQFILLMFFSISDDLVNPPQELIDNTESSLSQLLNQKKKVKELKQMMWDQARGLQNVR